MRLTYNQIQNAGTQNGTELALQNVPKSKFQQYQGLLEILNLSTNITTNLVYNRVSKHCSSISQEIEDTGANLFFGENIKLIENIHSHNAAVIFS